MWGSWFGCVNEQAGIRRERGYGGDSLNAISHIKLSQGAFRGNPPVSLVPPVSLLVGFPDKGVSAPNLWQRMKRALHPHEKPSLARFFKCPLLS